MREPLANGSVEGVLTDTSTWGTSLSAYAAFSFDALYAFIIAINQLLNAGVPTDAIQGHVLLEEMRKTSFTGVSGEATRESSLLGLTVHRSHGPKGLAFAVFARSSGSLRFDGLSRLASMRMATG